MTKKEYFDIEDFWRFCSALKIESKEFGLITLGDSLLGSQKYFIEEIYEGLNRGVHFFCCLKGRQLGISTICLALDLYWAFRFAGTQATLATDTEENRELFRSMLTMYMEGLPQRWKQPAKSHNRSQLVLGNRSRLVYQVAGSRKNVGFGAGKAIMMGHFTEVGKWGEVDLGSLEASLAEKNPHRLYIYESTAYGYGQFFDLWEVARTAESQKAIFVGWWHNDLYSVEADSDIFKVYWDGSLTEEEKHWVAQVKELYNFDITQEQIAWYRWKLFETMKGDEQQMFEKYPPTEEFAFQMTGSHFFGAQRLTDQMKIVRTKNYECHRFVFGAAFDDTTLVDSNEKTVTLKIWEKPQTKGQYIVGCDPAWGSSEWADRHCINVTRCWADQIEQVAEFCTPEGNTITTAWALLYLAGAYGDPSMQANVMINLEINGPGQAVWQEIQGLKQRAGMTGGNSNLSRLLQNIGNYFYRRPDSVGGGVTGYHTKTTAMEKERYLNRMKDFHESGILTINSVDCLGEMKNVVREEGMIGVPGRGKDDRVIAQALAAIAWDDFVRMRLIQARITRQSQQTEADMPEALKTAGRSVANYLQLVTSAPQAPRMNRMGRPR